MKTHGQPRGQTAQTWSTEPGCPRPQISDPKVLIGHTYPNSIGLDSNVKSVDLLLGAGVDDVHEGSTVIRSCLYCLLLDCLILGVFHSTLRLITVGGETYTHTRILENLLFLSFLFNARAQGAAQEAIRWGISSSRLCASKGASKQLSKGAAMDSLANFPAFQGVVRPLLSQGGSASGLRYQFDAA
ncbi:hypothetical protein L3X38_037422 [Prunus dulcis]|uniref:Uncharacterized protein n=1 Tax=Prunus dulcis TaxID=3755 RepID=A0AAD4V327_PRUDU|nr:hypothetical protein L3X38_037422 [Prunus dulcis]